MANSSYQIIIEPVLDTSSLNKELKSKITVGDTGKVAGQSFSNDFLGETKKILANRLKYALADTFISGFSNAMKDAVSNVRELDSAMTELKKVTDYTTEEYSKFADSAYEVGSKVARTGTEIVEAASEFAKMGYSNKEQILNLSEMASRFQNIADSEVSAADAAALINSQLKAFKTNADGSALTAENVIDKINEVSNNFGVSSSDISSALTKTAGAMATYGNTMDETIALVTAGTEVMPNQASKVARGWRTIGANVVKLAEANDTWVAANGRVNIALKNEAGELRSTYEIMQMLYSGIDGVSEKWDNLSDAEKSNIAISIAGKSQMEVFAASMNNFSQAQKAFTTSSTEYIGSSAKENEKYLDSIEGRIQAFQSAWEKLSKDLISSDMIKNVVGFGTTLLNVLDKLINTIGAFPTFGGLFIGLKAVGSLLNPGYFGSLSQELSSVFQIFKNIFNLFKSEKVAEAITALGFPFQTISTHVRDAKREADEFNDYCDEIEKNAKDVEFETIPHDSVEKTKKNSKKIKETIKETSDEIKDEAKDTADEVNETTGNKVDELKKLIKGIPLEAVAATAVIVGLAVALKAWGDSISFESRIEQYENINDELKTANTRMAQLNQKKTDGTITAAEERELEILKLQTEQLEKQLKFKKEQIQLAFEREASAAQGGGKAGDSATDYSTSYASTQAEIRKLEAEFEAATTQSEKESINRQLQQLSESSVKAIEEIQKAYDDLEYVDYKSLDADQKKYYNDIVSGYLSTTQSVQAYRSALEKLPKNAEISISAVDKNGSLKEVAISAETLQQFSDDEIQMLINAQQTGDWSKIEEYLDKNNLQSGNAFYDLVFNFIPKGEETVEQKAKKAAKAREKAINLKLYGLEVTNAQLNELTKDKHINVWVALKKKAGELWSKLGFAKGKREGEEGGMAWLGDEGSAQNPKPELVVGDEGAYLAGTSGWEMYPVKASDTVYTYAQTKKLLGGSQKFSGHVGSLPMYASGTNNEAFDDELAELEYQRAVKHWTDDYYLKQYKSLYSRYAGSLSASQVHSYGKFAEEVATDKAKAEIDRLQGILEETGRGLDDLVKKINNDSHFSADEKKELLQDAYKASVEYNTKEYKNGKDTRAKILEDIKKYYETRGSYDEEYYSMLNDLREADQDLEVERLSKLSNAEDEKLTLAQKYLQQQLDAVKKQIEANEEEADSMKDLKELQQDLADARQDMVRIYREGVGWVYEQNAEAIKDAQKAIEDYNREHMSDELEAEAEALQKVLDLFDDMQELSDIKELELSLGVGSLAELIGGNFGTNIAQWTKWIKSAIATQVGLEDLSTQIKNATGTDIDTWLGDVLSGGSHQASASTIASYISKHSFAGGTLSAGGGLSLVGENGAELAWLRKGDSVYSNAISSNLMQWGRYSPAEVLSGVSGGNKQTFNFDKIVLPNVKNADDFYKELQKLPNKAIQQSAMRA